MKIFIIILAFLSLHLVDNLAMADGRQMEPIVIPSEMKKITSPYELEVYLGNLKRIQFAAVKRLGQIGGPDAIWGLMKFYEDEPIQKGSIVCGRPFSVKEAVIDALGPIGSKEAKEQIIKILRDTLRFGKISWDIPGDERYAGQSFSIIYNSIKALGDFPDDDVIEILEEIAIDQEPPNHYLLAVTARESLLKMELKKQGFREDQLEDKVNYLVNKLSGKSFRDSFVSPGVLTIEAITDRAISQIITSYGFDVLPYVEEILKDIPENSERAEAIKEIIVHSKRNSANIEKAKEKAKNKDKPMEMLKSSINGRREKAEKNSK